MKSWKTLPTIGCKSYKLVSTLDVIIANAIAVSRPHDMVSQIISACYATWQLMPIKSYFHSWRSDHEVNRYLYSIHVLVILQHISIHPFKTPISWWLFNGFDDLLSLPLAFMAFSTIGLVTITLAHPTLNALSLAPTLKSLAIGFTKSVPNFTLVEPILA